LQTCGVRPKHTEGQANTPRKELANKRESEAKTILCELLK
jgi:hypothetical protein